MVMAHQTAGAEVALPYDRWFRVSSHGVLKVKESTLHGRGVQRG